jgi:hypothetical protein
MKMKLGKAHVSHGFGAAVILLSPIALIGTVLIAIAVGHDLIYFAGETPIALALCAPAAYLVMRCAAPSVRARLLSSWVVSPVSEAAD